MKKHFVFAAVMLTACLTPLKSEVILAKWSADKSSAKTDEKSMTPAQQKLLNKINSLPLPFTAGNVDHSKFFVQAPHRWQIKEGNDIYHAAILFEKYPEGIHSDSQRFLSLFMVWKNGRIYYRQVIENDPERIEITAWELSKSFGKIYLKLDYDFRPYFTDTFTSQKSKCSIVVPVTGHLHASIADFEGLPIGNLTIKNGEARAKILPQPSPDLGYCDETNTYRRKNPVYQLVFPHCYMVKNEDHTFHIALVDRQQEDLLAVYIWKDRKPHSVYLLDHYEQFYSTPDRLKMKSGPGATRTVETSDGQYITIPVWDGIFLRYVINNTCYGNRWEDGTPSSEYYKYNNVTIHLKNSGTYDMRKQQFDQGFVYSPELK